MLSRLRWASLGAALGAAGVAGAKGYQQQRLQADGTPVVALVQMYGAIAAPSRLSAGETISLNGFEKPLRRAFETPGDLKAVVIEINSPGGSPAQSSLLHSRIGALKRACPAQVPVLAYCTDICASGGYYIACAADEIHVLPASLVGSIGVVAPGFGCVEALRKLGVEDRTLTAGASKAGDAPWAARNPVEVRKKKAVLEAVHDDFKSKVEAARGDKLNHQAAAELSIGCGARRGDAAAGLFDGSVFGGCKAVELGLADGLYEDLHSSLKERFGDQVRINRIAPEVGFSSWLRSMPQTFAASLGQGIATQLLESASSTAVK